MGVPGSALPIQDHTVVCGLDGLGLRLVEDLRRFGEEVVVLVEHAQQRYRVAAEQAGAAIVRGSQRDPQALDQAGVGSARALALTAQDDVGNLHAALAAQELNPRLRIVARIFNEPLRRSMGALVNDCEALSASSIAAPLFVAAAFGEDQIQRISVAGRTLTVSPAGGPDIALFPLAGNEKDGIPDLLPRTDASAALVLAEAASSGSGGTEQRAVRRMPWRSAPLVEQSRAALAALAALADRRLRGVLVATAVLVIVSVCVFALFGGLTPLDALYFTVTTISTTGYGDITVLHEPLGVKIYGIALIVLGATSVALLYALLIDALVGVRLARALGAARGRMAGHVVVCGAGNVGLKVVQELARREIPVIVVERDDTSPNVHAVRRLGVPVILADASREESLRSAQIDRASSLIAVTDDDIANLEAALNARSASPDVRVVLRLFDHDLAARIDRVFRLSVSRSVSALVAPAFAAALLGRRVLALIPVGRRVLLVAEFPLDPGCELEEHPASVVDSMEGVRVLGVRRADGSLRWRQLQVPLGRGDTILAVVTREGLDRLTERSACRS